MERTLKIIRSAEWWEYKLPPLLGTGYATLLSFDKNIFDAGSWLLVILFSLIIGAVYVSIINDVTDLKDDVASGKKNRMQAAPPYYRWLLPCICLLAGLFFMFTVYYPDRLSMLLYTIPWILFSLYSFPPFRFKNRGIWGVLCDAGGSHIFTSLLMVSSVSFITGEPVSLFWWSAVGIWALCYGLRGILWHQYMDRDNDLQAGIHTVATRLPPASFKKIEPFIFGLELIATLCMLLFINNIFLIGALFIYILLAYCRYRFLNREPVVILTRPNQGFQILMLDYFQVFFPVTLLVYAAFTQDNGWIVLVLHVFLFPNKLLLIIKDTIRILKNILQS